MSIIGFNFSKINVQKNKGVEGKININNNVSITNVEEAKLSLSKSSQKGLKFNFSFITEYEPKLGTINLEGDILVLEEAEKADKILESWKKDKSMPKEIMVSLLNTVLNKCNIQALILSQLVNLPPPIQLPKVKAETK